MDKGYAAMVSYSDRTRFDENSEVGWLDILHKYLIYCAAQASESERSSSADFSG